MKYDSLQQLLEPLSTSSAAYYLKSPEARQEGSQIRQIIESGIDFIANNTPEDIAAIYFASIMLAGSTLTNYCGLLRDLDVSVRQKVERKLRDLLITLDGYENPYADWLSKNIYRLKPNSIKLIEQNGKVASSLVKYSLVVNFDIDTELKKFSAYVNAATKGMKDDKCSFMETAIEHTNDNKQSIDLASFKVIICKILGFPKLTAQIKSLLTGESMNTWTVLLAKQKEGEVMEDS